MDERQNKPSASYLEQMSLCPGSWRAQQGLPEQPNDDSTAGTKIHEALAGDVSALGNLSQDECRVYDELQEKSERLKSEHFSGTCFKTYHEFRAWNLSREFSAKCDRIHASEGGAGMVIDFKTGWAEVAESSSNLQLRAQVVCVAAELKCHTVYVAIVQVGHKPKLCKYELADINRAELEVLSIIGDTEKDNAPRVPGEKQCMYCKARTRCPERLQSLNAVEPLAPAPIPPRLPELPAAALRDYLDQLPVIERICDDLKAEAKRRLQSGEEVPGYKLKPGTPREIICDLPVIHARAEKLGIKTEDFTAACSLTKSAAKLLLTQATGKKGKELDRQLVELIDGCTTEGKTPEPQLERVA